MKMQEAMDIINREEPSGFMVRFEWYGDGFLRGDHFPDKHAGEDLILTESQAWILAEKFAEKMRGKVCNLYVVDNHHCPVEDYKRKMIKNR